MYFFGPSSLRTASAQLHSTFGYPAAQIMLQDAAVQCHASLVRHHFDTVCVVVFVLFFRIFFTRFHLPYFHLHCRYLYTCRSIRSHTLPILNSLLLLYYFSCQSLLFLSVYAFICLFRCFLLLILFHFVSATKIQHNRQILIEYMHVPVYAGLYVC